MLDLEADVQMGCVTQEQVNELIMLYSVAVEYYACQSSQRYLVYESKLQNLMIKPEIMMLMNPSARSKTLTQTQVEGMRKRESQEMKNKMGESQIVMKGFMSVSEPKYVQAMQNLDARQAQIDGQVQVAQQAIKNDLQSMKSSLQERLQMRKQK